MSMARIFTVLLKKDDDKTSLSCQYIALDNLAQKSDKHLHLEQKQKITRDFNDKLETNQKYFQTLQDALKNINASPNICYHIHVNNQQPQNKAFINDLAQEVKDNARLHEGYKTFTIQTEIASKAKATLESYFQTPPALKNQELQSKFAALKKSYAEFKAQHKLDTFIATQERYNKMVSAVIAQIGEPKVEVANTTPAKVVAPPAVSIVGTLNEDAPKMMSMTP
ncbi:MAG: hypothetical protein ABI597_01110 [Gammaproteobacteria bacterium]